jgi:hypothetical protein
MISLHFTTSILPLVRTIQQQQQKQQTISDSFTLEDQSEDLLDSPKLSQRTSSKNDISFISPIIPTHSIPMHTIPTVTPLSVFREPELSLV